MSGRSARRRCFVAIFLLALLGLVGQKAGPTASSALRSAPGTAVENVHAGGTLAETVLPTKVRLDNRSWVELRSHRGGLQLGVAVLCLALVVAAPLALVCRRRGRSERPSLRRRGTGAVLRAPPPLLST